MNYTELLLIHPNHAIYTKVRPKKIIFELNALTPIYLEPLKSIISDIIKKGIEPGNVHFYRVVDFAAGFDLGAHKHPDLEINYIIHGSCNMNFGDSAAHFMKNDCMVIYPNVEHAFRVDKKSKCTIVQLVFEMKHIVDENIHHSLEKELTLFYDLVFNDRKYFKIHDVPVVRQCLENIIHEINHQQSNREALINVYFSELLILLSRLTDDLIKGTQKVLNLNIKSTLTMIHAEYSDPELSVETIAKKCNISSRHLRNIFLNETGLNLIDYLIRVRIKKSCELLLTSSMNNSEIAYSVGYSSPEYFCRLFKKQTHFTPKDYKQQFRISQ